MLGTAPELPGTRAAGKLITGAVEYAAASYNSGNQTGTGLYVSLNCDYSTSPAGTPVAFLNGVEDIGTASASGQAGPLTVQGGFACSDGGTANTWEAESSGTLSPLTTSMLSGTASWPAPSCPVEEVRLVAGDFTPARLRHAIRRDAELHGVRRSVRAAVLAVRQPAAERVQLGARAIEWR